jgi:hypothetical protein
VRLVILAAVVGLLIGFGAGYVVRDQADARDSTITVQHKRDVDPCQQPLPPADCLGK